MLHRLLVSVLICLAAPAWATDCPQHYAGGQAPNIVNVKLRPRTQEVCFNAFAVMHSGVTRGPLWSAEHLLRASVEEARDLTRRDSFHAESALPSDDRAELSDYSRSGYDRGHMSPNGDMPDRQSQGQSFSLSNIVPQVHMNNAGVWAGIEAAVRQLAVDEGDVYVISGPAYIGSDIKQIGNVLVPTHLWKVVYSPSRHAAGAYMVTNDETRDYSSVSVADLERIVGLSLLPAVPEKVRQAGMNLPRPIANGGTGGGKRKTRGRPEDDYTLKDIVRGILERIERASRK